MDNTFGNKGEGQEGLKAARAIGMLIYRTSKSFVVQQTDSNDKTNDFRASSYIQYQGQKFNDRFDSLSYYYLTKCMDSHNVGRLRDGEVNALKDIKCKTLVIGIDTDTLVKVEQQKFLQENLPNAVYNEIHSDYGHDGFLIETEQITKMIKEFI